MYRHIVYLIVFIICIFALGCENSNESLKDNFNNNSNNKEYSKNEKLTSYFNKRFAPFFNEYGGDIDKISWKHYLICYNENNCVKQNIKIDIDNQKLASILNNASINKYYSDSNKNNWIFKVSSEIKDFYYQDAIIFLRPSLCEKSNDILLEKAKEYSWKNNDMMFTEYLYKNGFMNKNKPLIDSCKLMAYKNKDNIFYDLEITSIVKSDISFEKRKKAMNDFIKKYSTNIWISAFK